MKLRSLILSWVFTMYVFAQETKQPGNELRLEDVAKSAEGVCIAEFENVGTPDLGSPGSTYYSNAILKISRTMVGEKLRTLSCAYTVQIYPDSAKEEAPTLGKAFLMLGNFSGGTFEIKKLTAPTVANLSLVEQVLRERGIEMRSNIKTPPDGSDQNDTNPKTVQLVVPSSAEQPGKATDPKPVPVSEEPTSSTPWSIIAVLIVAALGLLWLLLKRRS